MSLFGRSRPRQLHPAWEYTPAGVLWRVQPATSSVLVAEERDVEKKQAAFLALNARDGELVWKRSFGDPWWVGLEAVRDGVLLLHGFTTPDLPEHKGVTAVDVGTGQVLWELADARFRLMLQETVLLSDSAGHFVEHQLHTGALVRDHGTDLRVLGDARGRAAEIPAEIVAEAEYPLPLEYAAEQDPALPDVLRALVGATPAPAAEVIVVGGQVVCAYRSAAENAVSPPALALGVVERSGGQVLFSDRISVAFGMPVADAFFVLDGWLYYVREQRQLVALALVMKDKK